MNVDVEAKVLLDKLYNLRSSDSVILTKMEEERKTAEETKNRTENEKSELAVKVEELNNEEVLLAKEGTLLKDTLKNINKSSFSTVFSKLNIDFDPEVLYAKVESSLPATIEAIKEEILSSNGKLEGIVSEMNDAITTIKELAIRKDEAISNQSKLNEYIDLALAGNINITRDALTNLLAKFDLSKEEQRECAKLLMFPEDGLYEYEDRFSKKSGKSIVDVFAEAKTEPEVSVNKEVDKAPFTIVSDAKEDVKPILFNEILNDEEKETKKEVFVFDANKDVDNIKSEEKEVVSPIVFDNFINNDVKVEKVEEKNVNVSSILTENGFTISNFSQEDIKFIESKFDLSLFEKNIELIKNLGLNNDIFTDNVELFIDNELEEKLDTLLNVGKVPFDIYLNPNILVKYDVRELKSSISSLKESGLDPKKVPLMAF